MRHEKKIVMRTNNEHNIGKQNFLLLILNRMNIPTRKETERYAVKQEIRETPALFG